MCFILSRIQKRRKDPIMPSTYVVQNEPGKKREKVYSGTISSALNCGREREGERYQGEKSAVENTWAATNQYSQHCFARWNALMCEWMVWYVFFLTAAPAPAPAVLVISFFFFFWMCECAMSPLVMYFFIVRFFIASVWSCYYCSVTGYSFILHTHTLDAWWVCMASIALAIPFGL